MALAVTLLGNTFNTTSGTHAVTATPAVGDLIVIITGNSGSVVTTAPTDNNSSGAYNLLGQALSRASVDGLNAYVRKTLIGAASSTIFSAAPGTTTGGGLAVYKITGVTNVADAIRQIAFQSNATLGTTPTPVFGVAALTGNAIISAVLNATTTAITARTSPAYTRDVGGTGWSSPTTGIDTMHVNSGETGTSIAWGGTSATAFASIAIEVQTGSAPGGSITIANMVNNDNSVTGSTFATPSWVPTANKLYIATITVRNGSANPNTPTASGNGLTWVQIDTAIYAPSSGGSGRNVTWFRAMGASPTTGATTFDFAGQSQTNAEMVIDEFTGMDTSGTNGSGAIVQEVVNNLSGGVDFGTVGLSAFGNAANAGYSSIGYETAGNNIVDGPGFTQVGDILGSFSTRATTMFRDAPSTVVEFTPDGNEQMAILALEISVPKGGALANGNFLAFM